MASLRVPVPLATGMTRAPNAFMRWTLGACRSMSSVPMNTSHRIPRSAATVAVATPCMPAPVSAISRGFFMRRASSPWPRVLLILCAPV